MEELASLVERGDLKGTDVEKAFTAIMCAALKDDVANVQIQSLKVACKMPSVFGSSSEIISLLETGKTNPDTDVQYFAQVCLEKYQTYDNDTY